MRRILALVLLIFVLSGCGQTSFVGHHYDNFTAYYNKFFNARKAFDSGVKSLEQRDTRIDRSEYLPLFINPDAAASSSHFQNTIKKSADVLRDHPNSKWVDDALLLIGKSYFYQRNYVGAEQKFLEVIGLKTALEDEARFWLARSLITGGNYEEAASYLTESMNRDEVSRRWKPMLQLALGELYVQRGQWEDAAAALEEGLESVRDNDLGARAQFLLGQIYETLGNYELSVEAYRGVERFRPLYELSYAAQLSAIRVEGSYVDEENALRELRRMERDDKHYQYRNELAYVRGRIYQMQGHADDAFLVYDDVLYNVDGDISRVRGPIHYAMGQLYRDSYSDYLTAAAHFDTAATQIGGAPTAARTPGATAVQKRYAPEAIRDATVQKEMFASFSDVMYRISEMDSLLYLGSLDEEAFDDAIMAIRRQLAEELAEQQREIERRQASQAFRDAGAAESARAGSGTNAVAAASGEAGFLYHRDPMLVEEARLNFQTVWGERPLVPNWRRRSAVNDYLASATDDPAAGDSILAEIAAVEDQLPVVDISRIPRDHVSQTEMRTERAAASYELANVLFLSMNEPDSAAVWYRRVIEDANDSTLIQRAYYALAEVQQALGDDEAAAALYENVVRISNKTELGRQISQRLGMSAPIQAEGDTLAAANAAYERAYFRWQRGNYRSALADMIAVAGTYPQTEVAPKALMAAGSIYADWARRDSLDLLGGIPVSVPDSVLQAVGISLRRTRTVADTTAVPSPAPADSSLRALQEPLSQDTLALTEPLLEDTLALASAGGEDSVEVALPPEVRDRAEAEIDDTDPDSLAESGVLAEVDSATVQTDDATPAPPTAAADSLVQPDSVGVQMAAAVDSMIIEEYEPLNLDQLYASIETRYAESPFASRAGRIRAALDERRQERAAAADSLARAQADSAGVAVLDSTGVSGAPVVSDSTLSPTEEVDETAFGVAPDSTLSSSDDAGHPASDVAPDSSAAIPDSLVVPDTTLPAAPASDEPAVQEDAQTEPAVVPGERPAEDVRRRSLRERERIEAAARRDSSAVPLE